MTLFLHLVCVKFSVLTLAECVIFKHIIMEIQYDLCLLQEILNLTSTLQSVLVSLIQYEHYKS